MRLNNNSNLFYKIYLAIKALDTLKNNNSVIGDWSKRDNLNFKHLISDRNDLKIENLENFRGKQIYVSDYPSVKIRNIYFKNVMYYKIISLINIFIGSRRGEIKLIKNHISLIKKIGSYDTLLNNKDSYIGNPLHYNYNGNMLTGRFLRHIYFYSIFEKFIRNKISNEFIGLDIGSSYGLFTGIIKSNMPNTRHILVDLEGQMILAEYYLQKKFPEKKIANAKDIIEYGKLDLNFIKKYDFILVPVELFDFLENITVNLVTNFLSLGEMSRLWFDKYIDSKIFKSAEYFFTINRYDSSPTYSNELTVLDYPFSNYTIIRFCNCPFFNVYVKKVLFFWYKQEPYSSGTFEFIGKRNK